MVGGKDEGVCIVGFSLSLDEGDLLRLLGCPVDDCGSSFAVSLLLSGSEGSITTPLCLNIRGICQWSQNTGGPSQTSTSDASGGHPSLHACQYQSRGQRRTSTHARKRRITLRAGAGATGSGSIPRSKVLGTHNEGTEWSFVVRWCRLRSASRANSLLHPLILQGQAVDSFVFFFGCLSLGGAVFFLWDSFLSSGCNVHDQGGG